MTVRENFEHILSQIPDGVEVVAVSKYQNLEAVREAYDWGHRDFGENKVQALVERSDALKDICPDIRWHMIGHLQTNKVKDLFKVQGLVAIHSVDSLKLIKEMVKRKDLLGSNPLNVYLQFNAAIEENKFGLNSEAELIEAMEIIKENFQLKGLMAMGPTPEGTSKRTLEETFQYMQDLRSRINPEFKLSMGMSGDYQLALNYGANVLRIGSRLFK